MSTPPPNAWQTAGRMRNSNAASRTPQTRSTTQSPSQPNPPTQPPGQGGPRAQQPAPQPSNVWAQRSSNSNTSNGPAEIEPASAKEETYQAVNMFNTMEVRALLSRDAGSVGTYKTVEAADASTRSGVAWGARPSHMANNQPFFLHLAKQVATSKDGG